MTSTKIYTSSSAAGSVGSPGTPGPIGISGSTTTVAYSYWSNLPDTEIETRSVVMLEEELIERLRDVKAGSDRVEEIAKLFLWEQYQSAINLDAIEVGCDSIKFTTGSERVYTLWYKNLYTYVLMCGINVPYHKWIYDEIYYNASQKVTFYWSKKLNRYEKVKGNYKVVNDNSNLFTDYASILRGASDTTMYEYSAGVTGYSGGFGEKQSKETKKQHKYAAKAYEHKVKSKPVNKHFNHRIKH